MTTKDTRKTPTRSAFIVNWLGRDFLKVGGVTLAMEGDFCRDCTIEGGVWTPETLRKAARKINRACVLSNP